MLIPSIFFLLLIKENSRYYPMKLLLKPESSNSDKSMRIKLYLKLQLYTNTTCGRKKKLRLMASAPFCLENR